ncbi:MAG: Hsp20/alpha crystallin family protein [Alphaproteobacteria bacterium]
MDRPFSIKLPAVDLVEDDGHYVMTAEMPGISDEDIEVALSEGVLTVKGEKRDEREEKKDSYRISERQYGSFQRSFRLPADVDADKIKAACKDGVLTVTIPRKPEAKVKKSRSRRTESRHRLLPPLTRTSWWPLQGLH